MRLLSKNISLVWGCIITVFLIYGCDSSVVRNKNNGGVSGDDQVVETTASNIQIADTTEVVTDRIDGESSSNVTGLASEDSESSGNQNEGGSVGSGEQEKVEEPGKPPSATSVPGEDETTQVVQSEDSDSEDSDSSSSDSDSTSSDETDSDEDSDSSGSSADDDSSSGSSEESLREAITPSDRTDKLKKPESNPEKVKSRRENIIKIHKVKKISPQLNKKEKLEKL